MDAEGSCACGNYGPACLRCGRCPRCRCACGEHGKGKVLRVANAVVKSVLEEAGKLAQQLYPEKADAVLEVVHRQLQGDTRVECDALLNTLVRYKESAKKNSTELRVARAALCGSLSTRRIGTLRREAKLHIGSDSFSRGRKDHQELLAGRTLEKLKVARQRFRPERVVAMLKAVLSPECFDPVLEGYREVRTAKQVITVPSLVRTKQKGAIFKRYVSAAEEEPISRSKFFEIIDKLAPQEPAQRQLATGDASKAILKDSLALLRRIVFELVGPEARSRQLRTKLRWAEHFLCRHFDGHLARPGEDARHDYCHALRSRVLPGPGPASRELRCPACDFCPSLLHEIRAAVAAHDGPSLGLSQAAPREHLLQVVDNCKHNVLEFIANRHRAKSQAAQADAWLKSASDACLAEGRPGGWVLVSVDARALQGGELLPLRPLGGVRWQLVRAQYFEPSKRDGPPELRTLVIDQLMMDLPAEPAVAALAAIEAALLDLKARLPHMTRVMLETAPLVCADEPAAALLMPMLSWSAAALVSPWVRLFAPAADMDKLFEQRAGVIQDWAGRGLDMSEASNVFAVLSSLGYDSCAQLLRLNRPRIETLADGVATLAKAATTVLQPARTLSYHMPLGRVAPMDVADVQPAHVLGGIELGLCRFAGVDRERRFVVDVDQSSPLRRLAQSGSVEDKEVEAMSLDDEAAMSSGDHHALELPPPDASDLEGGGEGADGEAARGAAGGDHHDAGEPQLSALGHRPFTLVTVVQSHGPDPRSSSSSSAHAQFHHQQQHLFHSAQPHHQHMDGQHQPQVQQHSSAPPLPPLPPPPPPPPPPVAGDGEEGELGNAGAEEAHKDMVTFAVIQAGQLLPQLKEFVQICDWDREHVPEHMPPQDYKPELPPQAWARHPRGFRSSLNEFHGLIQELCAEHVMLNKSERQCAGQMLGVLKARFPGRYDFPSERVLRLCVSVHVARMHRQEQHGKAGSLRLKRSRRGMDDRYADMLLRYVNTDNLTAKPALKKLKSHFRTPYGALPDDFPSDLQVKAKVGNLRTVRHAARH